MSTSTVNPIRLHQAYRLPALNLFISILPLVVLGLTVYDAVSVYRGSPLEGFVASLTDIDAVGKPYMAIF